MRSGSHCLRSCVIRGVDQRGVSPTLEGSPNFTTSQRLPTLFALLSPSLSSSRSRPQRHVLHSSLGLHSAVPGLCLPSRSSLTTSFFLSFFEIMVYIQSWQSFQEQAEGLYAAAPNKVGSWVICVQRWLFIGLYA